jgi:acetoacetyl-CoA synthetase
VSDAVGKAWESVLGVSPFEGDRLLDILAMGMGADRSRQLGHLLTEIGVATGVYLPLTVAFQSPTAADLSQMVSRRDWSPYVRPIRMKSAIGKALFVFPGLGALGLDVITLIRHLTFPGSIYLCPPQGVDGKVPHDTMDAIVADHVAVIRSVQPRGPYWLLGYSWGGVVALEIARSLRAIGEDVGFIGMIDPVVGEVNWSYSAWLGYMANRVRHHLRTLRQVTSFRSALGYGQKLLVPLFGRVSRRLGFTRWQPLADEADSLPGPLSRLWDAEVAAIEAYRQQYYDGKVTLFAMRDGHASMCDPRKVWSNKVSELDLRWLTCDHYLGPSVKDTADTIASIMLRSGEDDRRTGLRF